MQPGELTRRRKRKAIARLSNTRVKLRVTTTESLAALSAGCGPVKFHKILLKRGHATAVEGFDKGYNFDLPSEYGCGSYSISHHSFAWTLEGVYFIAQILREEGIVFTIPSELILT